LPDLSNEKPSMLKDANSKPWEENQMNSRMSYFNKEVYVGIDVHKASYSITAVCDRKNVKSATVKANPDALVCCSVTIRCEGSLKGAIVEIQEFSTDRPVRGEPALHGDTNGRSFGFYNLNTLIFDDRAIQSK
jgi:hypothetical protein